MIDSPQCEARLRDHLTMLTRTIGERSVRLPENLRTTAEYLFSFYDRLRVPVRFEPYTYADRTVANVVAEIRPSRPTGAHYILGAHYDSVAGTVGADDNASAVAVQLETARELKNLVLKGRLNVMVTLVSFALEEPPVYGTRYMGSRVFAAKARKESMSIDGMVCLEMVGYTCRRSGCQRYPFPLMFMGYPKKGEFIGIVGNFSSRSFTRDLAKSFSRNREPPVVSLTVPFSGWVLPAVRLSDHASFWDEGYRAVMVTDSAFFRNPHYHLPSDTMDTLDITFMARLVDNLVAFFHSRQPASE